MQIVICMKCQSLFSEKNINLSDAEIAQWHPTGDQEVMGSIPTGSSKNIFCGDHKIFSVVILSVSEFLAKECATRPVPKLALINQIKN